MTPILTGLYACNLCKAKGEEFSVPADEIGIELMKAHLLDVHDDVRCS